MSVCCWLLVIPRLHNTTGCQTGCTTGLTTGLTTVLNEHTRYNRLSNNRFDNRFDNRLYRVNGARDKGQGVPIVLQGQ